ncbi:FixH family protein [Rubellimicrobium sp. CFH 75288]|uniref:FixH family protein n=1 Tax=Rubellimicrobium sp. CFH 75288 TaxID=2697034 RepID=UPI0014130C2D|nr:FixH family protein [Rubellimicrobium sp. CFH 75288]NAZ36735.1 nitrogen fixation protein FixH [Rubellimicrobium sp. CFH 75288]
MTRLLRGPVTGPKALAIILSFFAVIIAVNLVLAVQAVRTFPGLEVRNAVIASQGFDADRAAQIRLGWTVRADIAGDRLALRIEGPDGAPVAGLAPQAVLGRATTRGDDQTLALVWTGTEWVAPVRVAPGRWHLSVAALAPDGTAFRQRLTLGVR